MYADQDTAGKQSDESEQLSGLLNTQVKDCAKDQTESEARVTTVPALM